MKNRITIGLVLIIQFACQQNDVNTVQASIDLEAVSQTTTLLGENLVSTPLYERDLAISPKLDEIIYTLGDYKQNRRCLVGTKKINGKWSEPEVLNISGKHQDIEPFYVSERNRLYFSSNRPIFNDSTRTDYNIWYSDRIAGVWSEPIALDTAINKKGNEFFPSLSSNGNLYFTATREGGIGKEDIFVAKLSNGKYEKPEPLPEAVNTPLFEFNAFISPNEDYLIFSSFGREDGMGGGDLYVSQKDHQGLWQKSRNLGSKINSEKLDFCPFVDNESSNFYFTSERTNGSKYKLTTVRELRERANTVENGFGNIYKIAFSELGIKKE